MDTAPSMVKRYHPDADEQSSLPEYMTSNGNSGGTPIPWHEPDDDEVINRLFRHR